MTMTTAPARANGLRAGAKDPARHGTRVAAGAGPLD